MANDIDPSVAGANMDLNYSKYAHMFSKDSANDALSQADFLKIMVEQMKNQDMYNTQDSSEQIAQMAQFTMVQSLENVAQYQENLYMTSLAGKYVVVASGSGSGMTTDSGMIESVSLTSGGFKFIVNGKEYDYKNIMQIVSDPLESHYQNVNGGSALVGKYVTIESVNEDGSKKTVEGYVDSVSFAGSNCFVEVGGVTYSYSEIAEVHDSSDYSNLYYNTINGGASLIGKYVTVKSKNDAGADETVHGVVSAVSFQDGKYQVLINGKLYSYSDILNVGDGTVVPEDPDETPDDGEGGDGSGETDGTTPES